MGEIQLQKDRARVAYNGLQELIDGGGLFADDEYALLLQARNVCLEMYTNPPRLPRLPKD